MLNHEGHEEHEELKNFMPFMVNFGLVMQKSRDVGSRL
jgi:hypothetical protein